jgi:hypothetical protein
MERVKVRVIASLCPPDAWHTVKTIKTESIIDRMIQSWPPLGDPGCLNCVCYGKPGACPRSPD